MLTTGLAPGSSLPFIIAFGPYLGLADSSVRAVGPRFAVSQAPISLFGQGRPEQAASVFVVFMGIITCFVRRSAVSKSESSSMLKPQDFGEFRGVRRDERVAVAVIS
jgi:hypothetical protein